MRGAGTTRRPLLAALVVGLLALTGCGLGRPAPEVTAAGGGNTVLLVGDELLGRAATRIGPSLGFRGAQATVVDLTAAGTGLLDAGFLDTLRARLDAHPEATTVVVGFTGHCAACAGGYAAPTRTSQWIDLARQVVDEIRRRGMKPVWVVAPPNAPDVANAAAVRAVADAGQAFAHDQGIVTANLIEAFTDVEGSYQPSLFYARAFEAATWHTVRVDGTGFTDDGATRAAEWIAAAVRAVWVAPLVVDVDMYFDVDDAGALGIAFALQQQGEAEILALGVDLRSDRPEVATTSWQCAAALASFYTGASVPIGIAPPRDGVIADAVDYTAPCAALAPADTPAPLTAVEAYRRALAGRPDGSVVFTCTGYAGNLAALLDSPADDISPLTGRQLVAQKVRTLVLMGGDYPGSTGEHNLQGDPVAAQTVAATWPTKIVWSGSAVGYAIGTGSSISSHHPTSSPLRVAYETFIGPGHNWYSWDLATVYHAVRPGDPSLVEVGPGTNHVDGAGGNTFTTGTGNQYYLRLTDAGALGRELERLLDVVP